MAYGYDVTDPSVKEELWRIYFESVAFLRDQLLEKDESLPAELLRRGPGSDVERLLVLASQSGEMGRWACALLRVMHIISHLDNDVRLEHFQHARSQIFTRFDEFIEPDAGRRWKFGKGAGAIPLVRYIRKERKDRNSTLIKLLSKPSAFVEEIYDRIGFRFVTESRADAYRLVQLMFDMGAVSVPNIHPGRSVNTLLPTEVIQQVWESTRENLKEGRLSTRNAVKRLQRLEDVSFEPPQGHKNPYSSRWYRAIQFTGRQLIVAPDPTYQFWSQIQKELTKVKGVSDALRKVPIMLREKRTFYYPFEVQIMDKQSYVESIGGRSRHREYKARQRAMARARVLRDIV